MSLVPLYAFALGFGFGGVGGIVLGFIWYEHKCGLLSDHSGKRAKSIWFELDDVFRPIAKIGGVGRYALTRRRFASSTRVKSG
jgi:hypothetical protein